MKKKLIISERQASILFDNLITQTIQEEQKKYFNKTLLVANKINKSNIFKYLTKEGFNDFYGRDLIIKRENELLNFYFDSGGWLFDTNDCGEGCAIIAFSKFRDNKDIRKIQITTQDKNNCNVLNSIYWITGGNREWRFDNEYNVDFDDIRRELYEELGGYIKKIINNSNTIGEIIDEFRILALHDDEFMYKFYDIINQYNEYFDDSDEDFNEYDKFDVD